MELLSHIAQEGMMNERQIVETAKHLVVGIDPGAGGLKVFTGAAGTQLPAQVAADGTRLQQADVVGLAQAQPPIHVNTPAGDYWVGSRAHRWGRPLESLDHSRFRGSPGIAALFYGTLEQHLQQHDTDLQQVEKAYVGLPQQAVSVPGLVDDVRAWLTGEHRWRVDGGPRRRLELRDVKVTTQPAAALFDYLLDAQGQFVTQRKRHFKREVGIISVGMSTVELLVVQEGKPVPRFTHAENAGVRRLLRLLDPRGHYSRGELDDKLRAGAFNGQLADALNVWGAEINGLIEEHWESGSRTWERFASVVVVGGGAHLLRHALTRKLAGKAYIPDDPVLAIARGLWKMAVQHEIPLARRRARRRD
jgi:hypothetical protein